MAEHRFDPASFYQFDLHHGEVRTRAGTRVLLLTESVLGPLVTAAARQGDLTSLRRLGKQLGEHVVASLGEAPSALVPETVLGHVQGVLGLFGWGRMAFERWGSALAAVVEGLPTLDDDDLGAASVLGGLFSSLAGREAACVPVGEGRFLVVDPGIAERIWEWSKDGSTVPSIVDRLASGASS